MVPSKVDNAKASVERGRTPADVQRLAYAHALAELKDQGITWTDRDTDHLRRALGIGKHEPPKPDLGTKPPDGLQAWLDGIITAADTYEEVKQAAQVISAHAARWREPWVETGWRHILANYARVEIGWWSKGEITARKLALLSVIAGIPGWSRICARREAKGQLLPSGADAIASERKTMNPYVGKKEPG